MKGLRRGYAAIMPFASSAGRNVAEPAGNPKVHIVETDLILRTHNAIDDVTQRPNESGGVYTYQAIAKGQRLAGCVRIDADLASVLDARDPDWRNRLRNPFRARIGASKKDDYGLVAIEISDTVHGAAPQSRERSHDGLLSVCLESDLVLRDSRLRYTSDPDCLRMALAQALGCRLDQPVGVPHPALARTFRHDGWHVGWNRPRSSVTGIAAGSCFVFGLADGSAVADERSDRVEFEGIGERRAEGYGRILIDPPWLKCRTSERAYRSPGRHASIPSGKQHPVSIQEASYLKTIAIEATRRWVASVAAVAATRIHRPGPAVEEGLAFVKDKVFSTGGGGGGKSQLGVLRQIVSRYRSVSDAGSVVRMLEHRQKGAGQDLSRDAGVQKSLSWGDATSQSLKDLVRKPQAIWDLLDRYNGDCGKRPVPDGLPGLPADEILRFVQPEAVRALVLAWIRHRSSEFSASSRVAGNAGDRP